MAALILNYNMRIKVSPLSIFVVFENDKFILLTINIIIIIIK